MNEPPTPPVTRGLVFVQSLLGVGAHLFLGLPYLRRTHGLERLRPDRRYLFVCNHVSLLDTILLGGLCWRSGCIPILVLGDKTVWHASWIKKLLSSRIGFLLDRGKLNPNRIAELQRFGRAGKEFQLVVFPEGTRGDGVNVLPCQPGIHYIAQEARLPIVPVFFREHAIGFHQNRRLPSHRRVAQGGGSLRRTDRAGDTTLRCRARSFWSSCAGASPWRPNQAQASRWRAAFPPLRPPARRESFDFGPDSPR